MSLDLTPPLSTAPAMFINSEYAPRAAVSQPTAEEPSRANQEVNAERRKSASSNLGRERRQFGSSHANLSPPAAELARAIDQYKLENRRRYITCEEMLVVIKRLGYSLN